MSEKRPVRILLVNYYFPPFFTIGSRRWAKFTKYLCRLSCEIDVIQAENPFPRPSLWWSDVKDLPIHRHVLPLKFPRSFYTGQRTLWGRIRNKAFFTFLKWFTKGIPYDESRFWEAPLQAKVRELTRQRPYDAVITSGPPFRLTWFMAKMKSELGGAVLITDFRDPWIDGKVYAMDSIGNSMMQTEKALQSFVMQQSDLILDTDPNITTRLLTQYPDTPKEKIVTIPHGFDPEDSPGPDPWSPDPDGKIRIVYGGTITMVDQQDIVQPFFKALTTLRERQSNIYHKLRFDFYSTSTWFRDIAAAEKLDIIHFHEQVTPEQFNHIARSADYLLVILPNHLNDYIITKMGDYQGMGRPMLLLSNGGASARFIQENNMGIVLGNATMQEGFASLGSFLPTWDGGKYRNAFIMEQYSIPRQAGYIYQLITNLLR